MQIWKFELQPGSTKIQGRHGMVPLHVATQGGVPNLWCQVDTDEPEEEFEVRIFGTGHVLHIKDPPKMVHTPLSQI